MHVLSKNLPIQTAVPLLRCRAFAKNLDHMRLAIDRYQIQPAITASQQLPDNLPHPSSCLITPIHHTLPALRDLRHFQAPLAGRHRRMGLRASQLKPVQ